MFYTFIQNNSHGIFKGPAHYVIVEANSADEANEQAQTIGLYFDGAGDCPCCGSRWYKTTEWDQSDFATIYGVPVNEYTKKNPNTPVLILYRSGKTDRSGVFQDAKTTKKEKWKSYVSGPKWAGIKEFLFELAQEHGLEIKFTDEDRGFLRTTQWFVVEGTQAEIALFAKEVENSILAS